MRMAVNATAKRSETRVTMAKTTPKLRRGSSRARSRGRTAASVVAAAAQMEAPRAKTAALDRHTDDERECERLGHAERDREQVHQAQDGDHHADERVEGCVADDERAHEEGDGHHREERRRDDRREDAVEKRNLGREHPPFRAAVHAETQRRLGGGRQRGRRMGGADRVWERSHPLIPLVLVG
eukprot:30063-Pleurochrysis_carterae.AAC.3